MAFTPEDKQFLLEHFASKQDLERFTTKDDIAAIRAEMATKADLEQFATKDDLGRFATKDDLETMRVGLEERMDTYHQRSNEHHLETRMMIRRLTDSHEELRRGIAAAARPSKQTRTA